jgi:hypothetical protein
MFAQLGANRVLRCAIAKTFFRPDAGSTSARRTDNAHAVPPMHAMMRIASRDFMHSLKQGVFCNSGVMQRVIDALRETPRARRRTTPAPRSRGQARGKIS